jgi:muramoyltetrapeptide carboxypeptidase
MTERTPPSEWLKCGEIDEICRRMSRLNMIVIAPGSGIVTAGQERLMKTLVGKYGINIPKTAMTNKNEYHCSDTVENRLKYFKEAIDSNYDIIWTIRGGFGTHLLISELDKWPIPKVKKTLVGFSDTTALHLFVTQKWGWKSIHAPVMIHLEKGDFSKGKFDTALDILEGRLKRYTLKEVYPINEAARRQKRVVGKLTGGNLTLIEASIGTCWEVKLDGKILFLEDINLLPWWIYRSMYHLKESGRLKGAKAIIFGRFVKGGEQKEIGKYFCKFADSVDIPVYVTDQFGHGNNNKPLVYDAVATLQNDEMTIYVE